MLLKSDLLLILGGFLDINALEGLESFTRVLQMNIKIKFIIRMMIANLY